MNNVSDAIQQSALGAEAQAWKDAHEDDATLEALRGYEWAPATAVEVVAAFRLLADNVAHLLEAVDEIDGTGGVDLAGETWPTLRDHVRALEVRLSGAPHDLHDQDANARLLRMSA